MHQFLLDLGITAVTTAIIGAALAAIPRAGGKPPIVPPDPRPPAVNLVWPDDVDALLADTAGHPDDVDRPTPNLLACGYCGHVSTGAGALEAIGADQAHFRAVHAFTLALGSAS